MKNPSLSFKHFFTLWLGASISIAEILAGGLLSPLGISVGMSANILGHLLGTSFLLLAAYIGFQSKLPAIASTEITFGSYGARIFSFLNLLQLIGWTAIMILSAAQSLEAISHSLWQQGGITFWILFVGALILLWTWLGPDQGWKKVNHITVEILFLLTLLVGYMLISKSNSFSFLSGSSPISGALPFPIGLELAIAMPLSWVPLIADYTRYGKTAKGAVWGSGLGYFFGSVWMYAIGLLLALTAGSSDLAAMMLAAQLGLAALGIILLSALTTTFLDVYSAGINLSFLFPRFKEKHSALFVGLLGTLLAFQFNIYQYEHFLLTIGGVFAPLFTVLFTDYFVFCRTQLQKEIKLNFAALSSWGIGMLSYYYLISVHFPWGATIPTLFLTFIAHIILGKFRLTWRNHPSTFKGEF